MKFMKGRDFTIAENFPATLKLETWAVTAKDKKEFGNQTVVLILEMPTFLQLAGAGIQTYVHEKMEILSGTEKSITRDGQTYRRYEIPFRFLETWYSRLGVGNPHSGNDFRIFLRAEPGKAGKKGYLYARAQFGAKSTPEMSYPVLILPPIAPLLRPARYFEAGTSGIMAENTPLDSISKRVAGYWRNLSEKAFLYRGATWKNPEADTLRQDWMFGAAKQFFYFSHPEYFEPGIRYWQKLLESGRVPRLMLSNGEYSTDPRATPVWYLLDDPEKLYEKYLTDGFRSFRKYYPEVKRVFWNYEPGVEGVDPEGLARFSNQLKLPAAPARPEVTTGKLRDRWFRYMINLHQEHLEKVIRIFRKEMPEAEFWICTDNLHAHGAELAYWNAVDSKLADKVVDGHLPMPYYSGARFFDDVKYNRSKLKKPYIPLNDPAENMERFFINYTPDKIRQNILASAALGCIGFAFWPDCTMSGLYFQRIRDAWNEIALAEEFYHRGTRCDSQVQLRFKNTVQMEFPYGREGEEKRKVAFPDYSPVMRYTLHEHNGEYLLTVFNYHDAEPLFVEPVFQKIPQQAVLSEIEGGNYGRFAPDKEMIVKVPPCGVKLLKLGRVPASNRPVNSVEIKRELDTNIKETLGSFQFRPIVCDGASTSWRIPSGGKLPMLMLKNPAGQQILISVYGSRKEIFYWHNAANQYSLGGFFLDDQSRISGPYPFILKNIEVKNGSASAVFEMAFRTPDAGEYFEYQDLNVTQTFSIREPNRFALKYTLHNGSGQPMKLGFRIQNRPFHTYKEILLDQHKILPGNVQQNLMFLKPGMQSGLLPRVPRQDWSGGNISIFADNGRKLVFHASDFAGIYIWNGENRFGVSVEPVSGDFVLAPGATRSFQLVVEF